MEKQKARRRRAPKASRIRRSPEQKSPDSRSGASKKLAISFSPGLALDVRRAAQRVSQGNVSAWLADAARQRLRHEALGEAISSYEGEHGVITDAELREVQRVWPRKG